MRAVFQRVKRAKVTVDSETLGCIEKGSVVLLAVGREDDSKDAQYMAGKIANLRVFPDENGKMQKSLIDTGGSVLLVSQFTLYGDVKKGNRPGFEGAASPDLGLKLFDEVAQALKGLGLSVETGRFGAHMEVELVNDGPVTILLSSRKEF